MALYTEQGVVLRSYKLGEADRIVVLYTKGRGKVRGVAKGVRRTKSKFGSRLENGSIVSIQLYEGRNLDTITQVERSFVPKADRTDIDHYSRVATMLEVVDRVTEDGVRDVHLFRLLSGALTEFDANPNPLVVTAFVAKLLLIEGVAPQVSECSVCGSEENLVAFQLSEGGVSCKDCRRGKTVTPEALAALSKVFDGKVRDMLDSTPDNVVIELDGLTTHMIEAHTNARLKSRAAFA